MNYHGLDAIQNWGNILAKNKYPINTIAIQILKQASSLIFILFLTWTPVKHCVKRMTDVRVN